MGEAIGTALGARVGGALGQRLGRFLKETKWKPHSKSLLNKLWPHIKDDWLKKLTETMVSELGFLFLILVVLLFVLQIQFFSFSSQS